MKRLLFGNPKPLPLPKVRFIRITRYKEGHFEPHPTLHQSGWEVLGPVRRPSWIEREGLMSPSELAWEREGREQSVGTVWAYWWNANQWSVWLPGFRLQRHWGNWSGHIRIFDRNVWSRPKQPKHRHISKKELRQWIKTERPFL